VDIIYTVVHRLGLFRLALFFTLDPLWDELMGRLHVWGLPSFHLDGVWPGVTDLAWVSLIIYLLASTSWTTGYTAASTASAGGGSCMRCTIRSAR
jgi:hypothetical protein